MIEQKVKRELHWQPCKHYWLKCPVDHSVLGIFFEIAHLSDYQLHDRPHTTSASNLSLKNLEQILNSKKIKLKYFDCGVF